jgi:hypothetical protein
MVNRRTFKTLATLLALAAGALGWSQTARAHRSASTSTPARLHTALRVKPQHDGLFKRGVRKDYGFQVQGDGVVTIHATVRLKSRIALSGTLKRNNPRWYTDFWKPKAIRKSFPAGRYTYCLVATDGAGHRARSCSRVTVL